MKNLWINKEKIMSIVLAGTLTLCGTGCARKEVKIDPKDNLANTNIQEVNENNFDEQNTVFIDSGKILSGEYKSVGEDNKYTLYDGAPIYLFDETGIYDVKTNNELIIVGTIETNGEYSLVELPNKSKVYVSNKYLIKCANLHNEEFINIDSNNDTRFINAAYLYDANGMYIGYFHESAPCYKIATNGEYTLVRFQNGACAYVLDSSLDNNYRQIDGVAFVRSGQVFYLNRTLTEVCRPSDGEMVYVEFITNSCAAVFDMSGLEVMYVKPESLDANFIVVDLDTQRMDCYIDYQVAQSYGTRTGKNSTPTHKGTFDIDYKQKDFAFTSYPGSYAHYWILFNENAEEGIHDLIGDDEQNYGNQAYQLDGSHGCVRVPVAASEFVYNNYNEGDMVLVRKK